MIGLSVKKGCLRIGKWVTEAVITSHFRQLQPACGSAIWTCQEHRIGFEWAIVTSDAGHSQGSFALREAPACRLAERSGTNQNARIAEIKEQIAGSRGTIADFHVT
jgi:hypothetical protein